MLDLFATLEGVVHLAIVECSLKVASRVPIGAVAEDESIRIVLFTCQRLPAHNPRDNASIKGVIVH